MIGKYITRTTVLREPKIREVKCIGCGRKIPETKAMLAFEIVECPIFLRNGHELYYTQEDSYEKFAYLSRPNGEYKIIENCLGRVCNQECLDFWKLKKA